MPAIRFSGRRGIYGEEISSGDTPMFGEIVAKLATVGATVIPAASLVTGLLFRSGSTAAYSDTLDTAANVLTALGGNLPAPAITVGSSFRWRLINSVAFADTLVLGVGMVGGVGSLVVAASGYKEFLFTFQNLQNPAALNCTTVSGSNIVNFVLPNNLAALPMGVSPAATNLMPGASVSGTGIAAGTTVTGIIEGQGGMIGVTISANATATNAIGVQLAFNPTITVDDIGGGTL